MLRVLFVLILALNLFISAYFRRKARAEETIARRQEGWLALARLLVAGPLLVAILGYAAYPPSMAWASLGLPAAVRWAGVGLGLALAPLLVWIFRAIGSNISETVLTKQQHALVTHGPYRWVRHPLYAAGTLLLLSLSLISANAFLLGWSLLSVLLIRFVVVPREEQNLLEKFGAAYRAYQQRTGRLLPRLGRSAEGETNFGQDR